MKTFRFLFGLMLVLAMVLVEPANATKIDFEDFNSDDYKCKDPIGDYYPDLLFTGAKILKKVVCTNYVWTNYPPHSGNIVFYNPDGNSITIDFAKPVSRVGIWVSAYNGGNIDAYDSSGTEIDTDSFSGNNFGNHHIYLEVNAIGIKSVILHDSNSQITYDDLEYDIESYLPSGYILDPLNSSIASANVTFSNSTFQVSTFSNGTGFYNLTNSISDGDYNYSVSKSGYNTTTGIGTFSNTGNLLTNITILDAPPEPTSTPQYKICSTESEILTNLIPLFIIICILLVIVGLYTFNQLTVQNILFVILTIVVISELFPLLLASILGSC